MSELFARLSAPAGCNVSRMTVQLHLLIGRVPSKSVVSHISFSAWSLLTIGQHDIDDNIDTPYISACGVFKKDHLFVKQQLFVQPVQRFV